MRQFRHIPQGCGRVKMKDMESLPDFDFVAALGIGSISFHKHILFKMMILLQITVHLMSENVNYDWQRWISIKSSCQIVMITMSLVLFYFLYREMRSTNVCLLSSSKENNWRPGSGRFVKGKCKERVRWGTTEGDLGSGFNSQSGMFV